MMDYDVVGTETSNDMQSEWKQLQTKRVDLFVDLPFILGLGFLTCSKQPPKAPQWQERLENSEEVNINRPTAA